MDNIGNKIERIIKDFFYFLLPILFFVVFFIETCFEEYALVWKELATFVFCSVFGYIYCEGLFDMKE